jgi:molecular chaperone DnaJ
MAIKDYYRVLNVKSSASAAEIKNAYRKLAMKYHPDHNINDELAANVFAELAEAYKTLSNATLRRQYNEERHVTAAQEYQKPVETIEELIIRMQQLNTVVKAYNKLHFNKDALLYSLKQLLPGDIDSLLSVNANLLKEFLALICEAAAFLSSHQTTQLITVLQPLYDKHQYLKKNLDEILRKQQKEERWEKNKIILAILLAVILCLIIFFAAGK